MASVGSIKPRLKRIEKIESLNLEIAKDFFDAYPAKG